MVLKWYRHTLFLAVVVIGGLVSCTTDNLQEQKHTEFKENKDSIEFVKKNKIKINQLDVVFKNRVHTDGFNGCVLIAQHGKVLYRNVAGFSNIKNKDSLKLNSAFQLASTSKTLTAGAILLLKEQNKLSVNDLVVKHLPNFPYKDITIQMLLSHRSGLSNYLYFCEPLCDEKNCYNNKAMDNEDVLSIIQTTQPALYAKPNKKFEYSNTNYALLASIVEKVSGMTFSNFMEQYMFQPLGMLDTWVIGSKKDSLCKLKTKGHNANGTLEQDNYADYVVGDKGIYSTIDDMYKWSDA
ncbi:MAG: serine hydrolase domain-containing protein, partial [Bacteroidia bacterium]